jgi:flagellar basal body rod protein FlgG
MNRAVYTAASGGMAALARLDAVAQNLANVGTIGYKGERVLFRVRPLDETAAAGAPQPIIDRTAAQVAEVATIRDFAQGPVRTSGNALDAAITGEGFFVVATPRGERYTRQGNFSLDREGFLVTQHGERVQGDGGDIRVGEGTVAIGEDGTVSVDGGSVGRLKLVGFGDAPALIAEGSSLFAAARGAVPVPLDTTAGRLVPEAIEGANVDAVTGMIELVDVSRGFETYMRAIERLDAIAARAINEVGRVG